MGSNETSFLTDALIFSDPNYAKKNKAGGGGAFDEHAIFRKWKVSLMLQTDCENWI